MQFHFRRGASRVSETASNRAAIAFLEYATRVFIKTRLNHRYEESRFTDVCCFLRYHARVISYPKLISVLLLLLLLFAERTAWNRVRSKLHVIQRSAFRTSLRHVICNRTGMPLCVSRTHRGKKNRRAARSRKRVASRHGKRRIVTIRDLCATYTIGFDRPTFAIIRDRSTMPREPHCFALVTPRDRPAPHTCGTSAQAREFPARH